MAHNIKTGTSIPWPSLLRVSGLSVHQTCGANGAYGTNGIVDPTNCVASPVSGMALATGGTTVGAALPGANALPLTKRVMALRHRFRCVLAAAAIACSTLSQVILAEQPDQNPTPVAEQMVSTSTNVRAVARVSDQFVNLLVQRHVARQQYMQEYVMGTLTSGPVFLEANVTAELIPYSKSAALDIRLIGTTECRNHVGARGPVTISSSAAGQIDVRKRVLIGETGIHAEPATATCTAQVQINDISAQSRIVERLAWRRTKRMHGEIEQAAAQTSGSRTEKQLDDELYAPLAEADKVIADKLGSSWSKKLESFPVKFALSSTQTALQAALTSADGSLVPRAATVNSNWDVYVALHQNCFDRLGQAFLAGKKVDDTTLLDIMEIATGNCPRPLWVHDRAERWSVVISKDRPLTGIFADDLCSVTLRLQQVTRGTESLDRPLEIHADYALEITPDGPHLIRKGDLEVRFSDNGDATTHDDSFRRFVHSKFNGFFQPEIYFDGLVPPAGGSLGKLRILQLQELASQNGWLSIGYRLPLDSAHVAQR